MISALIILTAAPTNAPGTYGAPPAWEDAVRLGNIAVQNTLIDPDSARIEWPYTLIGGTLTFPRKSPQSGWYTCGFVNAKNRFGGYVGREFFLILFQGGRPTAVEVGGRGGSGIAEATCADLAKKGWLRPSGLESLGAMNPSAIPPTPHATEQAFQGLADAGAQQQGGMGVALLTTPAGAVIMAVAAGSPAEKAGLKVGQIIESLGGVDLKGMPMSALTAIMKNQPQRIELKIAGVGKVMVTRSVK